MTKTMPEMPRRRVRPCRGLSSKRFFLVAPCWMLACGYAGDDLQITDPALVGAIQVDAAIAAGGQRVTQFTKHGDWSIIVARAAGDRTLSAVSKSESARDEAVSVAFLVGDAQGVRRVSFDSARVDGSLAAPVIRPVEGGPNPMLLWCGAKSWLIEALENGTLSSSDVNQGLCDAADAARGGVVGASRDGSDVLVASSSSALLTVQIWHRANTAAPEVRMAGISSGDGRVLAVAGSASDGVQAVLLTDNGTLILTDVEGTERTALAEGDDHPIRSWIEPADNHVVWTTRSGSRAQWNTIDGPDEPVVRYVAPAPGLSTPDVSWSVPYSDDVAVALYTVPNERAAASGFALPVAVRGAALHWRSDQQRLVRTDAATTPCASRASCRLVGESTLIGAIPNAAGAMGIYTFWSWTDLEAVVISPIERPEEDGR